jgi:hypothetical protein
VAIHAPDIARLKKTYENRQKEQDVVNAAEQRNMLETNMLLIDR